MTTAEKSQFCTDVALESLPEFFTFVVDFMITLAKDFATRSIHISEETTYIELKNYQTNNEWKSRNHAYLFFNTDRDSFTFFGFNIKPSTGQIIDQITGKPVEGLIMNKNLLNELRNYSINFSEEFHKLSR